GITLHERVASTDIPEARSTYYFTGKINGEIDQNNQFQLSVFGNPRTGDISNNPNALTWGPDNFLTNRTDGAYDIAAKYTSKFNNGQTQIDALAGFHRGYQNATPENANGALALVYYNYTRSLFDFADLEGANAIARCNDNDPNNPYPKLAAN